MAAVLVGIDSGGTRTSIDVRVEGSDARQHVGVVDSLSGALEARYYDECLRAILGGVRSAIEELGQAGEPVHVFISAAAYSTRSRDDLRRSLGVVGEQVLGPSLRAAGIANDAVSLLLGHRADAVVIAGTGSNILVRGSADPSGGGAGDLIGVGGHEWVGCDNGSGFWIALSAIRALYLDHEFGRSSALLTRFLQTYGVAADDALSFQSTLRRLGVARPSMKKEIARFAAPVGDAAEAGDPVARDIVERQARELGDLLALGLRRGQLPASPTIVQCGGIFSSPLYRAAFQSRVTSVAGPIDWRLVSTASDVCTILAGELRSTDWGSLADAYRPAVVRFP